VASCAIRWRRHGAKKWVSDDKRLTILRSGANVYSVVDLDTYNERSATTLREAKRAACALVKPRK